MTAALALVILPTSWLLAIPVCVVAYPAVLFAIGGLPGSERRQMQRLFARGPVAEGELG